MSTFDRLCVLLAWLLAGLVFCKVPDSDPCTTYITLTDPTMDVSYTKITTTGTFLNATTWYRYTNSRQSILASSCPTGNACGTSEQVWMNGSVPSYSDGPVLVDVCYKDATGCCASRSRVRARNCKTFLVYLLNPLYGGNRWCFDMALRALPPVPTTTTTEAGLSPVMLAAIGGGGGLGLLLLIIILIAVVRHKLRARTVEPTPPKPSQNVKSVAIN